MAPVSSRDVSDFLRHYLTVGIFLGVAVLLVSALLGVSSLLRPSKPTPQKHIVYESGVNPVGTGWSQSQIRYYIFALLFVMFDVEAVFIFPWATRLEAYGRDTARGHNGLHLRRIEAGGLDFRLDPQVGSQGGRRKKRDSEGECFHDRV